MREQFQSGTLPVLALRGIVIYPQQTVHFDIGRVKSALALEKAMKNDQYLMLIPQLKEYINMSNLTKVIQLIFIELLKKN